MEPERGISLLDRAEQILVPLERKIRVVTTLQQQLAAAELDRLVDLAKDLLEPQYVALDGTDRAVERAEVAPRDADVRVVDVAVDDIGDQVVWMLPRAYAIGQLSEQRHRGVSVQGQRFVAADADAASDVGCQIVDG